MSIDWCQTGECTVSQHACAQCNLRVHTYMYISKLNCIRNTNFFVFNIFISNKTGCSYSDHMSIFI